jgi:hypothetical protein
VLPQLAGIRTGCRTPCSPAFLARIGPGSAPLPQGSLAGTSSPSVGRTRKGTVPLQSAAATKQTRNMRHFYFFHSQIHTHTYEEQASERAAALHTGINGETCSREKLNFLFSFLRPPHRRCRRRSGESNFCKFCLKVAAVIGQRGAPPTANLVLCKIVSNYILFHF